jgi:lysophospholipid acyltransferase (LPLAT)-like uncharacterized protein
LATVLLVALARTWRIRAVGVAEREARLRAGDGCIFAVWHARLLPLVFTHRGRGIVMLVSRHRDGEWIARVIERLGFGTARGSSTRGGEEGLREMVSLGEAGRLLGITPDGPRGPAEVVKPGLVFLASRLGRPVIPVASAGRPAWILRSWDRFQVPRPFARVVIGYGDPIEAPAGVSEAEAASCAARIQAALRELTARVEAEAERGR